jgi:DNA-binding NtrC family response regulator
VKSILGKGSIFSVTVPYVGRVPREYLTPVSSQPIDSPDLTGMTVLLVEDEHTIREEFSRKLMEWGCYVIEASSVEALIEKLPDLLGDSHPNLLISDYRLPGNKTGIQAVHAVRKLYCSLPAVIWSGEVTTAVIKDVADNGLQFLSKPIPKTELIRLLVLHSHNKPSMESQTNSAIFFN